MLHKELLRLSFDGISLLLRAGAYTPRSVQLVHILEVHNRIFAWRGKRGRGVGGGCGGGGYLPSHEKTKMGPPLTCPFFPPLQRIGYGQQPPMARKVAFGARDLRRG